MKTKNLIHSLISAFLIVSLFSSCTTQKSANKYVYKGKIDYNLSKSDEVMLDSIQRQTFQYFVHESHPEFGIVRDRTAEGSFASIAATGWGLPTLAVGVERHWMSREEAANRTLKTLKFFYNSKDNCF